MLDFQTFPGITAEGLPMSITRWLPPGAPVGTELVEITGTYAALDGGGPFAIERTPAGGWHDANSGAENARPDDLLPWVVAQGDW